MMADTTTSTTTTTNSIKSSSSSNESNNKDKLLQFWDEYYLKSNKQQHLQHQKQKQKQTNSDDDATSSPPLSSTELEPESEDVQEWITTPTNELFDFILSRITAIDSVDIDKTPPSFCGNKNIAAEAATAATPPRSPPPPPPPPPPPKMISVLEIGCGTSTLSRDFYLHHCTTTLKLLQSDISSESCHQQEVRSEIPNQQQQQNHHHRLLVRATDGSQVCIDTCLKRDQEFLRKNTKTKNNDDEVLDEVAASSSAAASAPTEIDDGGGLEYEVLNILERSSSSSSSSDECGVWDAILDKGCLDTFFFRSRNRGGGGCSDGRGSNGGDSGGEVEVEVGEAEAGTCCGSTSAQYDNRAYPSDVRTILDNIWLRLANDESEGKPNAIGGGGVYILISPRRKIKAVRDYGGFVSVEKHIIESDTPCILERKNSATVDALSEGGGSQQQSTCYMYVCRKNHNYKVGVSDPFPRSSTSKANSSDGSNNDDDDGASSTIPSDDDVCPRCGVTFGSIRKGRDMKRTAMERLWNGHRKHCKG